MAEPTGIPLDPLKIILRTNYENKYNLLAFNTKRYEEANLTSATFDRFLFSSVK